MPKITFVCFEMLSNTLKCFKKIHLDTKAQEKSKKENHNRWTVPDKIYKNCHLKNLFYSLKKYAKIMAVSSFHII